MAKVFREFGGSHPLDTIHYGDRVGCIFAHLESPNHSRHQWLLVGYGELLEKAEIPPLGVIDRTGMELARIQKKDQPILLDNGRTVYHCEIIMFSEADVRRWERGEKVKGTIEVEQLRSERKGEFDVPTRMKMAQEYLDRHGQRLADLQKLSTRELLQKLNSARTRHYWDDEDDPADDIENLKAVLSTREHIPNKVEARKIRQERARLSRGHGKSRNK